VRGIGSAPGKFFPRYFGSYRIFVPLLFPWHLANTQGSFPGSFKQPTSLAHTATSFLLMWFNAIVAGVYSKSH